MGGYEKGDQITDCLPINQNMKDSGSRGKLLGLFYSKIARDHT